MKNRKSFKNFWWRMTPFYKDIKIFYYVTAENRDNKKSNIEIEINKTRSLQPNLKIYTWDDLCDEMEKYDDILYRFYLKNIPSWKAENMVYNLQNIDNTTIFKFWESISDEQIELFKNNFINKINLDKNFTNKQDNESILILWLHWVKNKWDFDWESDLDLDFSILYNEDNKDWLDIFLDSITKIFKYLQKNIWLKTIIIKSHIQPCLSIYIWKSFKKSTSWIEFISLINNKEIFISSKSEHLLYSEPWISEKKIYIKDDGDINNIALFYNVSQNNLQIKNELFKETFKQINPKYWFYLEWNRIGNSSHWFSQIKYVVNKINTLANEYNNIWESLNIHFVLICPEQIALIIWTLIERINANIYLYYQNDDSTNYILFDKLPKQ